MNHINEIILYDLVHNIIKEGEYLGSIITKCKDEHKSVIFSDKVKISNDNGIFLEKGLTIGFEILNHRSSAFSRKLNDFTIKDLSTIEYCVKIPDDLMLLYDEGQFSDTFPFTINLLHTSGLYLDDYKHGINHFEFFYGEILKNPISLINNGIILADRVVIDHHGDPVFYDCLIVGRDENENLKVSYEPLTNVDDKVVEFIIILGIEELKT
ncbi:MAG: hypothetical protein KGD73_11395 [Candidatus Lokiarchaeota archaeon]|nr:hypothetical protein [Candidatus Lokiarchaeota archaeon]